MPCSVCMGTNITVSKHKFTAKSCPPRVSVSEIKIRSPSSEMALGHCPLQTHAPVQAWDLCPVSLPETLPAALGPCHISTQSQPLQEVGPNVTPSWHSL